MPLLQQGPSHQARPWEGCRHHTQLGCDARGGPPSLPNFSLSIPHPRYPLCLLSLGNKRSVDQVLSARLPDPGAWAQDIMGEMTGARSVPRVFIQGKVGCCTPPRPPPSAPPIPSRARHLESHPNQSPPRVL